MIHVNNNDHGYMIMRASGSQFSPGAMSVISRSENGICLGGVIYENYTGKGGSCLVHIAGFSKTWINRDMLWIMFHFPFVQLDCTQAFAQVAGKNETALEFCKNIGWEEVIRLEAVFPDDDMILLRMRRATCRFLKLKSHTIQPGKARIIENGQA